MTEPQATSESIRSVLQTEQLERQMQEAKHSFAHLSDDELRDRASLIREIVGGGEDARRDILNLGLEMERRGLQASKGNL
jgi:hypothetical protein